MEKLSPEKVVAMLKEKGVEVSVEQADKGYSQRGQEELLRRYCDINKLTVRKVIYEDHSAKTFDRPEWQST